MEEIDIVKTLSKTRKPRAPLYLNNDSIDYFFSQRLGGLTSLIRSEKLGGEVSASLLQIISTKVSAEAGVQGAIQLSPILKAILLEAQAHQDKEIVDISRDDPKMNSWLSYIGSGQFIVWDKDVSTNHIGLDSSAATIIQKERARQEQMLKFWNKKISTVVWLADSKDNAICSIISTAWINGHLFTSYVNQPNQGIFGRFEKKIDDVVFVAPIWIWNEGQ